MDTPAPHIALGSRGESLACDTLERAGYEILATRYRTRIGEIDIVARDRKQGEALALRSTPSIFVNGRPLMILSDLPEDLESWIQSELELGGAPAPSPAASAAPAAPASGAASDAAPAPSAQPAAKPSASSRPSTPSAKPASSSASPSHS